MSLPQTFIYVIPHTRRFHYDLRITTWMKTIEEFIHFSQVSFFSSWPSSLNWIDLNRQLLIFTTLLQVLYLLVNVFCILCKQILPKCVSTKLHTDRSGSRTKVVLERYQMSTYWFHQMVVNQQFLCRSMPTNMDILPSNLDLDRLFTYGQVLRESS